MLVAHPLPLHAAMLVAHPLPLHAAMLVAHSLPLHAAVSCSFPTAPCCYEQLT